MSIAMLKEEPKALSAEDIKKYMGAPQKMQRTHFSFRSYTAPGVRF